MWCGEAQVGSRRLALARALARAKRGCEPECHRPWLCPRRQACPTCCCSAPGTGWLVQHKSAHLSSDVGYRGAELPSMARGECEGGAVSWCLACALQRCCRVAHGSALRLSGACCRLGRRRLACGRRGASCGRHAAAIMRPCLRRSKGRAKLARTKLSCSCSPRRRCAALRGRARRLVLTAGEPRSAMAMQPRRSGKL